ncbi:ATP-binding cassette domain-containing protein [Ramlibacter sp. 2FC]|uniref:ATP-binding cassette domain-containing protein n=1 Tax=Ramlibacter sp. 2FC TaxID=2502188 RepID=UPI0010F69234|nr:ATP-binding cassette domain-containing protein [Ramlibacter sp. 2FC]
MNIQATAPAPTATGCDTALRVEGLGKSYGRHKALDEVCFSLRPGQWGALLGENGAGKSTLVQLLCGLFTPDQGRIEILGLDLAARPCEALAQLGVVFQQPTLDLDLSVLDNLRYHAGLHGMAPGLARQRIAEGLDWAGLEPVARARARTLSGGNRRKLELVRALLHAPRLLLMDEATVGLDTASRQQLLELVERLVREQGLSVLWTTHWVQEVARADALLVLKQGRLRFAAPPAALLARTGTEDLEQAFLQLNRG